MTMVEVESRLAALEAEVVRLKQQLEDADLVAAVREGNAQLERGEGVDAVEAIKQLGREFGLKRP